MAGTITWKTFYQLVQKGSRSQSSRQRGGVLGYTLWQRAGTQNDVMLGALLARAQGHGDQIRQKRSEAARLHHVPAALGHAAAPAASLGPVVASVPGSASSFNPALFRGTCDGGKEQFGFMEPHAGASHPRFSPRGWGWTSSITLFITQYKPFLVTT